MRGRLQQKPRIRVGGGLRGPPSRRSGAEKLRVLLHLHQSGAAGAQILRVLLHLHQWEAEGRECGPARRGQRAIGLRVLQLNAAVAASADPRMQITLASVSDLDRLGADGAFHHAPLVLVVRLPKGGALPLDTGADLLNRCSVMIHEQGEVRLGEVRVAAAEHLEKVDEAEAGVVGTQECGERAHVRLDERGGPEQGEDVVSVRPEQTGDRLPTKGGDPCVDRAVPVVVRELHALGVRVHARVGQDQSPRKPQVKGWTIHLMVDFGEPKIQGAEKQSIQDKRARADAIVSHLDGALAKSIAGEGA